MWTEALQRCFMHSRGWSRSLSWWVPKHWILFFHKFNSTSRCLTHFSSVCISSRGFCMLPVNFVLHSFKQVKFSQVWQSFWILLTACWLEFQPFQQPCCAACVCCASGCCVLCCFCVYCCLCLATCLCVCAADWMLGMLWGCSASASHLLSSIVLFLVCCAASPPVAHCMLIKHHIAALVLALKVPYLTHF